MAVKDLGMVTAYAYAVAGGYTGTEAEFKELLADIPFLMESSENYPDGAFVEEGVAYFTHNGNILFEITGIGGGGGGGGGSSSKLTVTNTTGWLTKTIAEGASCSVSFTWSSTEDDISTGPGTLRVTVNGSVRTTKSIDQGSVSLDISSYLKAGSNTVKFRVTDLNGMYRDLNFSVSVVSLSITSSFDVNTVYTSSINFSYTPFGAVAKTVYFILDGVEEATYETTVSGRQLTQLIPAQDHGAHSLVVYFESTIDGETIQSNELYFEFISVEESETDVIISSQFNQSSAVQYATINVPFKVYNPASLTAEVGIYVNDELVSTQTVDRTEQVFAYRADTIGDLEIEFASGSASRIFELAITESDVDAEAETENLALYLDSKGRSNNEEHPDTWEYGDISASFSGFNWSSDGWVLDSDGITALRVSGDGRVTIPYQPFAEDFRTSGKTIEVDFATKDVRDYDAVILSCMSGGRGINLTAQKAILISEQSEISMQYKENEHIRVSFVVQKRNENRLLMIYINGVMSGVIQYPVDDDFSQVTPVDISIGSSDCTTDIYCIRVYDNNLTRSQILNNWIADTQIGEMMYDRYIRNNIYDEYGNIVVAKLPSDLPYMIITAAQLPQSKGDKKTVSVSYTDPVNTNQSFTAENVQADVQGTSSQYYARKNYKMKFNGGFTMNNGQTVSKYAMNSNAIPTKTFTFKADVASSEGANNVELARLYNDICPYRTSAQTLDPKVRQGIDGFPIVVFWNDGNTTQFMGKYNFNNDKGTEEVFGFAEGDESWEILNNTSSRVIWKNDDYTGTDWLNDFEARYPDTDPAYTDSTQLAEFAAWLKSTDRDQATGDALAESVTYEGVTYTTDSAGYRLAKFKDEASNYMELQSALFYYLFTELFLMVDSRAKNAFPSFIGGAYE